VVLVAVLSTIRGRVHSSAFGREVNQPQVQRAISLTAVALATVFLMALMITFSESNGGFAFIDLLFESISALATNGLSTGVTADLSRWGHVILIASMFLGRVGPLSLSLAMIEHVEADLYRYAQERVTIG
jgi:trk system potassium uptake protein TrkH